MLFDRGLTKSWDASQILNLTKDVLQKDPSLSVHGLLATVSPGTSSQQEKQKTQESTTVRYTQRSLQNHIV